MEKLWRGEAAPRTPKTKADQMKAELKDPLIKVKQNPIPDDVYNIEALVECIKIHRNQKGQLLHLS